jgi:hypothetical protein
MKVPYPGRRSRGPPMITPAHNSPLLICQPCAQYICRRERPTKDLQFLITFFIVQSVLKMLLLFTIISSIEDKAEEGCKE